MEDLGHVAVPISLGLLSDRDQSGHRSLCTRLSACRLSPDDILELIREFCVRDSPSDWKRCYVCGVFFLPSGCLAFHFRTFQVLVGMSKSAWFGRLRASGYSPAPNCATELRCSAPLVAATPHLAREWAFRRPPIVPHREQHQSDVEQETFCLRENVDLFFDDPFSLPPAFLLDDCTKSVCHKTTVK
jgi:hypothetical protein